MNGKNDVSIEAKSFIDEDGNLFFDVSFQDGKELIEKRVSVSTFIALLDGNIREEEKYVVFPKLASNVYVAKISSSDKSSFDCLCIYKTEKRAFSIAGELLRIPFPALLMHTRIRQGARNELHIYALDTDEPNDRSLVYEYPFANVYKDGSVCMGNIVSRSISSIKSRADSGTASNNFSLSTPNASSPSSANAVPDIKAANISNSSSFFNTPIIEKTPSFSAPPA